MNSILVYAATPADPDNGKIVLGGRDSSGNLLIARYKADMSPDTDPFNNSRYLRSIDAGASDDEIFSLAFVGTNRVVGSGTSGGHLPVFSINR